MVNKRFKDTGFLTDDLVSVGTIGLMKAVDYFDLSKNFVFSTFATACITQEIFKFIKYENNKRNYDFLEDVFNAHDSDQKLPFEDVLKDDTDTAQEYANQEVYKLLRTLLETSPEKENIIIQMYFGIGNGWPKKQREIAKEIKCTHANVSALAGVRRTETTISETWNFKKKLSFYEKKKLKNKKVSLKFDKELFFCYDKRHERGKSIFLYTKISTIK